MKVVEEKIRAVVESRRGLKKIKQHQTVQHKRSELFAGALIGYTLNSIAKGDTLYPKLYVQLLHSCVNK